MLFFGKKQKLREAYMNRIRSIIIGFFTLCLTSILVFAQNDCPAIVQTALDAVDQICESAGRNQACYGNFQIEATAQVDASNFTFSQVGDVVDVNQIQSLRLNPMNEEAGTWGVALMRLQANIPDTLPGQNVTFLLFGDVEITANTDATQAGNLNPMQAFYLRSGIGDAGCAEAPENGLLVQTPDGVNEVAFNINGVDVAMGSTVFFTAQPNEQMRIRTVEGSAVTKVAGRVQAILEGTQVDIPVDADLIINGLPELPVAYVIEELEDLPLDLLEREIEIALPLAEEALDELYDRLQAGRLPCSEDGDGFLPSCNDLPFESLEIDLACFDDEDASPRERAECIGVNLDDLDFELPFDMDADFDIDLDLPFGNDDDEDGFDLPFGNDDDEDDDDYGGDDYGDDYGDDEYGGDDYGGDDYGDDDDYGGDDYGDDE